MKPGMLTSEEQMVFINGVGSGAGSGVDAGVSTLLLLKVYGRGCHHLPLKADWVAVKIGPRKT